MLDRSLILLALMHYFDHFNRFTIRKNSLKCQNTNLSVIKTIRVHLDGILPWIEKHPSLKVGTPCPQKKLSVCFFGNFSAQTWPNSKSKVSFENYRF